jgi:ATP-dependent exoDNAse (exonuclease V) alpha subunit
LKTDPYSHEGTVTGKFDSKNLPTHQILNLKIGAQVMLLNNDPGGRWINGSIGKIIGILEEGKIIGVELSDGQLVEVTPFQWDMFRFFFNEDSEALESESVGSFKQYPLRLAWAVTIHKSQGKTFGKVIVDMGGGAFAHGQTYVALSRCTNFEGLVLKRPILKRHILLDDDVVKFMATHSSEED